MSLSSTAHAGCGPERLTTQETSSLDMDAQLPSDTVVRRNPENETIAYLQGENLSQGMEEDETFRRLQSENLLPQIALSFLNAHRSFFKLIQPADELRVKSLKTDNLGLKHVRFEQVFEGLAVWACEIIVHLDTSNHVYLLQGRYIPTPKDVNTRAGLSPEEACRIVANDLEAQGFDHKECRPELVIFVQTGDIPHLTYQVSVTPSLVEAWIFMIDAETGDVLMRLSNIHTGRVKGVLQGR